MRRAWLAAIAVLLVGVALHYFLFAAVESPWPAMFVLASAVVLAGYGAAYFAPYMKLLVGAAVAVPAAVLVALADILFGVSGHYSEGWPGPLNSLLAAIVMLPVGAILGSVGAFIGAKISRGTSDA